MQHQTTYPIQPHQLLRPARAAIYARVSSDQQAERQTIADDRECPCVACIALEHEPAVAASLQVMRPAREKRADAAMRTPLHDAPPERRRDQAAVHFAGMREMILPCASRNSMRGLPAASTFRFSRG